MNAGLTWPESEWYVCCKLIIRVCTSHVHLYICKYNVHNTFFYQNDTLDIAAEDFQRLQSIGLSKRNDSAYVRESLQVLYKEDLWRLTDKSLQGRAKNNKEEITPEKMDSIKRLFQRRLSRTTEDPGPRAQESYLRRLVSNGIGNIKKKYVVVDAEVDVDVIIQEE